jgi:hypothetical protein
MSTLTLEINRERSIGRFLLAVAALAVVWLAVLPAVGRVKHVQERIERDKEAQINPAALYYTELECLPPLLKEVDQARTEHPAAFWIPFGVASP